MAWEWETGLRSRIFRLRRPNIWARLHYGLDKDGVYSPKIEARGRRQFKKLCLAGIPVSSWPSVMDAAIDCALIPCGFEELRERWRVKVKSLCEDGLFRGALWLASGINIRPPARVGRARKGVR